MAGHHLEVQSGYKEEQSKGSNKTKVISANLLDFDFDLDLNFYEIFFLILRYFSLGNISVLVTFQFW